MIGFHVRYRLLIAAARTSKGQLPHPVSVSVPEQQSPQPEIDV